MESVHLSAIVADLQRLIYSSRDTSSEDNSIHTAHTLRNAFQRATVEFVRPASAPVDGKIRKNGQILDHQLRLLKQENRDLQEALENVIAATTHVQHSHRATMLMIMNGKSAYQSGSWERHPLGELLKPEDRKCEVRKHTLSEEEEELRLFAGAIKQILRDADSKFFGLRDVTERVAFENFAMRYLLRNREDPVDYERLVTSFRSLTSCDPSSARDLVFPPLTQEDIERANHKFEAEYWEGHEADKTRMTEMLTFEGEGARWRKFSNERNKRN